MPYAEMWETVAGLIQMKGLKFPEAQGSSEVEVFQYRVSKTKDHPKYRKTESNVVR